MFFMLGLIPDMAILRDEAIRKGQKLKALIYAPMALAWRGTNHQWLHYMRGYLIFAAIATPLVFSVHSIVSGTSLCPRYLAGTPPSLPHILWQVQFFQVFQWS